MSTEEQQILARLVAVETLADEEGRLRDVPAWQFGANVAIVLCTGATVPDHGTVPAPLDRAEATTLGEPEELLSEGVRNLLARLLGPAAEISAAPWPETEGEHEHRRWRLTSPDPLLSSGALFLGDLLDAVLPSLDAGAGVLVALPEARTLVVREVTEGMDLYEGINGMAGAAIEGFTAAAEPVSPFVFLVHENRAVPITSVAEPEPGEDPERPRIQVDPPEYIVERVRRGTGPASEAPGPEADGPEAAGPQE